MKDWLPFIVLLTIAGGVGCRSATQDPDQSSVAEPAELSQAAESAANCPAASDAGVVQITPGLTATILKTGHGQAASVGDYADVHTTLWLYDENSAGGRGEELWTSGGEQPFQFQLGSGQVIKGWDMGVPCMLIGETRELIIAGELAYGSKGRPPTIPPNATLLFNIELVKLTPSAQ